MKHPGWTAVFLGALCAALGAWALFAKDPESIAAAIGPVQGAEAAFDSEGTLRSQWALPSEQEGSRAETHGARQPVAATSPGRPRTIESQRAPAPIETPGLSIRIAGAPAQGAELSLHRRLALGEAPREPRANWVALDAARGEPATWFADREGRAEGVPKEALAGDTWLLVSHPRALARWIALCSTSPGGGLPAVIALEPAPPRTARVQSGGSAIAGARVAQAPFRSESGGDEDPFDFHPPVLRVSRTDAAGRAELHHLHGPQIVTALADGRSAPPHAGPVESDLIFELASHFAVEGHIEGPLAWAGSSEARVIVRAWEPGAHEDRPLAVARPTADGRFEISGVPHLAAGSEYALRFEADGALPDQRDFVPPRAGERAYVHLVAEPAARAWISVRDGELGTALAGAKVMVLWDPERGAGGNLGWTDGHGRVQLAVPADEPFELHLKEARFAPLERRFLGPPAGEERSFPVALSPFAELRVRVHAEGHAEGRALGPVSLLARSAERAGGTRDFHAEEAAGEIVWRGLEPGRWHVIALVDGMASEVHEVRLDARTPTHIDMGLAPRIPLAGRLVDEQSGSPIAGAKVVLSADLGPGGPAVLDQTMSDLDGRFALGAHGEGPALVTVWAEGHAPHTLPLRVPAAGPLALGDVVVPRGASLALELYPAPSSAAPAPAAWLKGHGRAAFDATGRTELSGAPGEHTLHVALAPGVSELRAARLPGELRHWHAPERELQLALAPELLGDGSGLLRIVYQDPGGARVHRSIRPQATLGTRLPGIPAREVDVFLERESEGSWSWLGLPLGDGPTQVLYLEDVRVELELHVVDGAGRPVQRAEVWFDVQGHSAERARGHAAFTDRDGRLRQRFDPGRSVDLWVHHPTHGTARAQAIDVTAGAAPLRIALDAAGRIELFTHTRGQVAGGHRVALLDPTGRRTLAQGTTDGEGRLAFDRLAPADYRLEVFSPGFFADPARVSVAEGHPAGPSLGPRAETRLDVRGLGSLELRIADASGPRPNQPIQLIALDLEGNVELEILPRLLGPENHLPSSLTTDATGLLRLDTLPEARYLARFPGAPHADAIEFQVRPGELTRLGWVLE